MTPEDEAYELKRKQRIERMTAEMRDACNDAEIENLIAVRPWAWVVTYHDGIGIQFYDANGNPVLPDLIREPELAATLFKTLNSQRNAVVLPKDPKALMRTQIEQIKCLIDAAYNGYVHNLRIVWDFDDDFPSLPPVPRSQYQEKRHKELMATMGKHTEVWLSTPAYYGTITGDLVESAYTWRERLVDKLDDNKRAKIIKSMDDEYGPVR